MKLKITLLFTLGVFFIKAQSVKELQTQLESCFKTDNIECIEETCEELIDDDKNYFNWHVYYYGLGYAARENKNYEEALKYLAKAIDLKTTPNYLLTRAKTFYLMGKKELALSDAKEALELDPKNVSICYRVASFYESNGDLTNALTIIESGLLEDPFNLDLGLLKARILREQDDFAGSLKELDALISSHETNASLYNNRADVKLAMKDLDGALEDAQIAVELDENNPIAHLTLGEVYQARGNNDEACKCFKQSLELGVDKSKVEKVDKSCQ